MVNQQSAEQPGFLGIYRSFSTVIMGGCLFCNHLPDKWLSAARCLYSGNSTRAKARNNRKVNDSKELWRKTRPVWNLSYGGHPRRYLVC